MTIRDRLAARFAAVMTSLPFLHLSYSLDANVDAQHELTLALADECLRQMEWARRAAASGEPQDYVVFGGLRQAFPTLSAAPEGWTVP